MKMVENLSGYYWGYEKRRHPVRKTPIKESGII
jgi:hypothetical protein